MPVPNVASKMCMLVVVHLTLQLSGQFLPCEGPLLIDSFPECDPRLDDYFATCNVVRTTAALTERDDDLPAVAVDCKFGATGNSAVHSIVAAYQIFTNSPEGLRRCTELLYLFLRSGANPNIRRSRDCRAPSHDAVFLTSRSSSPTGLHWAAQTLRDWGAQADTMEDLSGYTPLELSLALLGRDHRLTFALAGCTNISFPSRPDLSSESSLVQKLCQPCPPGHASWTGRLPTLVRFGLTSDVSFLSGLIPSDDRSRCIKRPLPAWAVGLIWAFSSLAVLVTVIVVVRKPLRRHCLIKGVNNSEPWRCRVFAALGGKMTSLPEKDASKMNYSQAIKKENYDFLNLLTKSWHVDADKVSTDMGELPLTTALRVRRPSVVKLLLNAKANPLACDPSVGKCPLMISLDSLHDSMSEITSAASPSSIAENILGQGGEVEDAQQAEVHSLLLISIALMEKSWAFGLAQHALSNPAKLTGGHDSLPMMLARCGLTAQCLEVLSVDTAAQSGAATYTNKDGENLLHVAASAVNFRICDRAVELGANVITKDGSGHTAIMRARTSSSSFPTNHYLACHLALQASDLYAVVDAVEGAWLARLTPPYTSSTTPIVLAAVQLLVTKLTQKLEDALEKEDVSQLEESIELVKYSRIQGMPDEARAICSMSRLKLLRGVKTGNELELKQAVINAKQYNVSAKLSEEVAAAEAALKTVSEQKAVSGAIRNLEEALSSRDPRCLCHAVLKCVLGNRLLTKATIVLRDLIWKLLEDGLSQNNVTMLDEALRLARRSSLSDPRIEALCRTVTSVMGHTPTYVLLRRLETAAKEDDPRIIFETLSDAVAVGLDRASPLFDRALERYHTVRESPRHWKVELGRPYELQDAILNKVVVTTEPKVKQFFQALLDDTHKVAYTRDRRNERVPARLRLQDVVLVQNERSFAKYRRKRSDIRGKVRDSEPGVKQFTGIKTARCWHGMLGVDKEPLQADVNEFYLFHGTTPMAAEAITSSDFKMDAAAGSSSNAGEAPRRCILNCSTLLRVLLLPYLMYDLQEAEGPRAGQRALLLCRVLAGRILYSDDVYPRTGELVSSVASGEFDSVIGDREKCRNTFREFIVYDEDQVYPEFVIWYTQEFS
ncbi:hypothetical protein FOL46_003598 [Perkinsus olseni]|uniref:Poly [ADP-ribose] polymerase n=1 Tax=Perkinsus olseni TaxID=32597 RepID=A0A7J6M370_PEROL|nr:hypothetical protein FOL46_003598 [Perkinsus olseni]